MELSDEDRQRLDSLMERHLNGELSDEEYQRRSWEILKESDPNASRQSSVLSGVAGRALGQEVAPEELEQLIARTRKRRPRRISLVPVLVCFVLGLVFAFAFVFVRSALRGGEAPEGIPEGTVIAEMAEDQPGVAGRPLYFSPVFGDLAVEQCRETCRERQAGEAVRACVRDCARLSLEKFGRRITATPVSAEKDAELVVQRCTASPVVLEEHSSGFAWEEEVQGAAGLLFYAASRVGQPAGQQVLHDKLLLNSRALRVPPGGGTEQERVLVEKLIRGNCLRAYVLLTEAARSSAAARSDRFSQEYYARMQRYLHPRALEYETTVSSLVEQTGFKPKR